MSEHEFLSSFRATCLKQDGVIIPNEAKLYAMLIESDALQADSALVDDERTCDFQIARHINDFQVRSVPLTFKEHRKNKGRTDLTLLL